MLVLEVVDDRLQRRVAAELESVPERPGNLSVLQCKKGGQLYNEMKGGGGESQAAGARTFCFCASTGSEKPKKGRAKLTKPFLYCSTSALPSMI